MIWVYTPVQMSLPPKSRHGSLVASIREMLPDEDGWELDTKEEESTCLWDCCYLLHRQAAKNIIIDKILVLYRISNACHGFLLLSVYIGQAMARSQHHCNTSFSLNLLFHSQLTKLKPQEVGNSELHGLLLFSGRIILPICWRLVLPSFTI